MSGSRLLKPVTSAARVCASRIPDRFKSLGDTDQSTPVWVVGRRASVEVAFKGKLLCWSR